MIVNITAVIAETLHLSEQRAEAEAAHLTFSRRTVVRKELLAAWMEENKTRRFDMMLDT